MNEASPLYVMGCDWYFPLSDSHQEFSTRIPKTTLGAPQSTSKAFAVFGAGLHPSSNRGAFALQTKWCVQSHSLLWWQGALLSVIYGESLQVIPPPVFASEGSAHVSLPQPGRSGSLGAAHQSQAALPWRLYPCITI